MIPLMNNTKWDELRLAMHALEPSPRWRARDVESGFESEWDRDWFHHFRSGGYTTIEWVDIEVGPGQTEAILEALRVVHVPGEVMRHGYRVYGYRPTGEAVDFL